MKVSFYLLIFIVILGCLVFSYKSKISEKFGDVPESPVISSVIYENNSILLNWSKPVSETPITNYLVFIKKKDGTTDGVYLHLISDPKCTTSTCTYTINNLNLLPSSEYYVSVIARNENGASLASKEFTFSTSTSITPTTSQSPSPTIDIITPTPMPLLEDKIRMMENEKKTYFDNELQNMIIRADGIYEVNKDELSYPDTYLNDVKQSISTINDMVKKDLQEYRLNVHLSSSKNN